MIPIKHSNIFKSRWWALLWAAGIVWFAYDFVAPGASSNASANTEEATDATGSPVTNEDEQKLAAALNSF